MLGAFSRSRGAWLCAASLAGASSWACRVSLREASCEAHASGIAGPSPLPSPPPHPLAPPDCVNAPGLPHPSRAQVLSPPQRPCTSSPYHVSVSGQLFPLQGESQSLDTFTPSPERARRAGHAGRVPRREPGMRPPRCPQGHRTLDGPRVSELRPHGHQSCGADPPSLQLDPRRGSAGHFPRGEGLATYVCHSDPTRAAGKGSCRHKGARGGGRSQEESRLLCEGSAPPPPPPRALSQGTLHPRMALPPPRGQTTPLALLRTLQNPTEGTRTRSPRWACALGAARMPAWDAGLGILSPDSAPPFEKETLNLQYLPVHSVNSE